MQGSKVVERATRTRTKNVDRVEKLLEREKKKRAIKERAILRRLAALFGEGCRVLEFCKSAGG